MAPAQPSATDNFRTSLNSHKDALEANQSFESEASARKGKHYFMWDFVNNTMNQLDPNMTKQKRQDIARRCHFTSMLLDDVTSKLAMMTGSSQSSFSNEVKQKGKERSDSAGN